MNKESSYLLPGQWEVTGPVEQGAGVGRALPTCLPPPAFPPLTDQRILPSPETFTVFEMSNPAGSYCAGVMGDEDFAGLPRLSPRFGL